MSVYDPRGIGANRLPHRLHCRVNPDFGGGVEWDVECPYPGENHRPCGTWVACYEHPVPRMPMEGPKEDPQAWAEFDVAYAEYRRTHPRDGVHFGAECWYEYMLQGDGAGSVEPEYFLADFPAGVSVVSPMLVQVGWSGDWDEADIKFRPWKEEENE